VDFGTMDKKYKDFVSNIGKLVRTKLHTDITFESFEYDSVKSEIEFHFVVNIPGVGKLKDSDLTRIFKRWTRDRMVLSVNSMLDGKDKIYLGIVLDMRILPGDIKNTSVKVVEATNEIMDIIEEGVVAV
jgi:hypothetical protein